MTRLRSRISLKEFGQAMRDLDLASVPMHKRPLAIKRHLLEIMGRELLDPGQRLVCRGARLLEERDT